jgi:chromosome segregation ATPase
MPGQKLSSCSPSRRVPRLSSQKKASCLVWAHDQHICRFCLQHTVSTNPHLQDQLGKVKNELADARADAEQLQSLAAAGDRSQSDLAARVTAQAAEVRAGHLKVQQLQEDLQQRLELYEEARMAHTNAQAVIRHLDGERDKLQSELDQKAERLAVLEQEHVLATGRIVELEQSELGLESRLGSADKQVQQLEQEVQAGLQRAEIGKQNLVSLQQDYERLQVCCDHHSRICMTGCHI